MTDTQLKESILDLVADAGVTVLQVMETFADGEVTTYKDVLGTVWTLEGEGVVKIDADEVITV